MKKFRILTTDNQWLYANLIVFENCIRCSLNDENDAQVLDPRIELRAETFGELVLKNGNHCVYEGDIVQPRISESWLCIIKRNKQNLLGARDIEDGTFYIIGGSMSVLGNIHDNPELLEDK